MSGYFIFTFYCFQIVRKFIWKVKKVEVSQLGRVVQEKSYRSNLGEGKAKVRGWYVCVSGGMKGSGGRVFLFFIF